LIVAHLTQWLPPMRGGTRTWLVTEQRALDLPLRVLTWEKDGLTRISYEDPQDLKARYDIDGADEAFTTMSGALGKLTTAASR
jgi:uncharacterized protein (DUF302 family)